MLQDLSEFDQFCKLLLAEKVRSYLEVGCWSGGTIQIIAANVLSPGARIVAVDKPFKPTKEAHLRQTINDLTRKGFDARVFIGDSTDPKIIAAAKERGPYDAVFIDGDHRIEYVKQDWENYGTMGRVVGFHDIARDVPADAQGGPHEVASFWKDFKQGRRHKEFISEASRTAAKPKGAFGIGVVWNV